MDKKAKKRVEVIKKKLPKLRQLLAAAKAQLDDPEEVPRMEKEIADLQEEISKLKAS